MWHGDPLFLLENLGSRQLYMDPGDKAVHTLTGSTAPGSVEGDFVELPLTNPALSRIDWTPVDGRANTWRASTRDPGIVCPASIDASAMRFFVVVMSCSCEEPQPHAQLFWTGKDLTGFNERLSLRFPLIADGRAHAYILDLHAGADPGALNYLWWHRGRMDAIRFDPLDLPGEFTISVAGFAHQDRMEAGAMRKSLRLAPLRTELSYRYLRGSGIEIGALQSPLALRPDTYVRYADRLTLAQARAHYPELDSLALVDPSIISDAAALCPVAEQSVDFVIANHVLEHLIDPLAALGEWLRVVRPGGYVYVAVPEHTNPLDRLRQVTELGHLIDDFKHRAKRKKFDREHYREWVASTRPDLSEEQRAKCESELVSQGYAIHFHMFSTKTFSGLLQVAERYFPAELLEFRRTYGTSSNEFIAIIRKL
jgi:SAM-dependent methyltransferase